MARTLLDIVQGILSKIDSDAVSSIGDTVEADQIADLVKQTYFDIIQEFQLPGQRVITNLEGVGSQSKPNVLKLPVETQSLLHWQYDCRLAMDDPKAYKPIEYKLPHDFLEHVNHRDSSDTDTYQVVEVAPNVFITVDKTTAPQFWTSFDDVYIVTDNYNSDVDATLQGAKTQAWLEKQWPFEKTDTFVLNLPGNLDSLLYRTAENEAYAVFKQTVNPKLEQKEKRLRIRAQRSKHRTQQIENNFWSTTPDYGRK